MRTNKHFSHLVIGILAVLLTGCSFYAPVRVEEDFGKSVRQMVQEQIYDKQTASTPAVEGPDSLDGEYGDSTVNEYRKPEEESEKETLRITF